MERMERAVDDPQRPPFRRDQLTWLAYGMLGFYNYLLSGLGPLVPSPREELRLSYTLAGLHFSVGIRLAYTVVPVLRMGALLASRLGRRLSQHPAVDLVPG